MLNRKVNVNPTGLSGNLYAIPKRRDTCVRLTTSAVLRNVLISTDGAVVCIIQVAPVLIFWVIILGRVELRGLRLNLVTVSDDTCLVFLLP